MQVKIFVLYHAREKETEKEINEWLKTLPASSIKEKMITRGTSDDGGARAIFTFFYTLQ
jgi:hypothetical protein